MAFTPDTIRVLTLNVGGLNVPTKRHIALREFLKLRASVVLIQETHFALDKAPSLRNHHFPTGYFGNCKDGKVRGTPILFSRHVPFTLLDTKYDEGGRYTLVKGTIGSQTYTFASVYLPNRGQHRALRAILRTIRSFTEGILLMGGDLNLALDPRVDTSRGTSSVAPSVHQQARLHLHDNRLIDCWRTMYPTVRDYTYYSTIHDRYSRIDYLLIPSNFAHLLQSVTIGATSWADHCPVLMTIASSLYRPKSAHWRLNETLLNDPAILTGLRDTLQHYFIENTSPDSPPPTIWEAHKAVARGYLISQGARLKRERTHRESELLTLIRNLELSHKNTLSDQTYAKLLGHKAELHSLLNISALTAIKRTKRLFYDQGNKCGKLLAHALRKRNRAMYIPKLRTPTKELLTHPRDLMDLLLTHFTDTYNIPAPSTPRLQPAIDYIWTHLDKSLPPETRRLLEQLITGTELTEAIKWTPVGKAPGPMDYPSYIIKPSGKFLTRNGL
uniref:exodeoxyribonuclease III n=1 Tax=Leptobrachium leishanense TaxID=445787 RepID=A0A8C5MAV6_9ANUR